MLRTVRVFIGMTQKELANELGVHHTLINKMEKERITIHPRFNDAIRKVFSNRNLNEYEIKRLVEIARKVC